MKKIYLSVLSLAIVVGASAQKQTEAMTRNNTSARTSNVVQNQSINVEKAVTLWSDDFSSAATWTVANTNTGGQTEEWSIITDPTALPDAAGGTLTPLTSATAANGFALINSDANNSGDGSGTQIISTLRTATAIDLSANPNVILEFAHNCRWWQESRTVRVSGDNGATWTDFIITDNAGYEFGFGFVDQNTENPSVERINISSIAGGMSQVLVEFEYNDNDFWGWYWAIDDVKILDQPLDDVINQGAFISGTGNEGSEYGRTPVSQLDASYQVGMQVYNFGANDQASTMVSADFGAFSYSSTGLVESDSVRVIESMETPSLALGTYTGAYSVDAGTDVLGGDEYGDNTGSRTFEVTDNIYSLDGIGVYPANTISSTGTGQFTLDAAAVPPTLHEDNVICATMYHIKSDMVVNSLEVLIDASVTLAGAEIYGSIIDTATLLGNGTTALFAADPYTVTAADVTAGMVTLSFTGGITLTPDAYYAAVELVSNGGTSPIRISDDETVAQPAMASAIFLPGAQTYSNGVAFGIRLVTAAAGINENTIDGVSVYPNPSKGVITISNDNNTENAIAIFNVLGKEVYSTTTSSNTTVDLSTKGAGVYLVKVSNGNGTMVERVVIK